MGHLKELIIKNSNTKLFIRYVIFAGFATLIDFCLLYLLTEFFSIWYFYSAFFAYLTGMIVNYNLNKFWNFRNLSKKIFYQFGLFFLVGLIGLGLNQIILYFFVEFFGIWYITAKIISACIVMFWSFYGHKKLAFGLFK